VTSPHVCRVFDLVEAEGQELVSMEYVDGLSLEEYLQDRSPLDIGDARDIATQMLAGLGAIHDAGLIHRDLKPGNVMRTRSGRVVVMDLGLARGVSETLSGGIAGTPAYMAPEQIRGGALDARTDVFAAGVILAEMVNAEGIRDKQRRRALWESLRAEPPQAPPGPWEDVIGKALAEHAEDRIGSAAALARALEDGSLGVAGSDELSPYPGLSPFTEAESKYFFGRDADIESVWKMTKRLPMLALIGPSGVGKSSLLRAGLMPAAPRGWNCVICTPGPSPFASLAQSLVGEFTGETGIIRDLFRLDNVDSAIPILNRWRQRHDAVLLVVDQFEELFTLNSSEVQATFAELLGRMTVEADVHVLVSLRDDFFFHCHEHPPLVPLFTSSIPLGPLSHEDLRQAITRPAQQCGYRFEDESLVEEMLSEVSGERGALPLLAFAAVQLWERRDRNQGLITRQAYEEIGGVAGALGRHAEATLERIGEERQDIVRDVFRSLVTAQGTRVVRGREDLLSEFEERDSGEEVLKELVDARLLTSFEAEDETENGEQRHQIEIVHESLLSAWPRLLRWRSQDEDSAQLRDQLRQAAQLWRERSESDDLLWTGTAFKEFELWRERYVGGLGDTETAFAEAMEARNRRQQRRRRIAVTTAFGVLVMVLVVVGGLWQRSTMVSQSRAALNLRMLAENALDWDNTRALALATASLEAADSPEARELALRALYKGPVRFVLPLPDTLNNYAATLSPDGQWFAATDEDSVKLYPRDGGTPRTLKCEATSPAYRAAALDFHPDGRYLIATRIPAGMTPFLSPPVVQKLTLWSVPDGRLIKTWDTPALKGDLAFPYVRGDPPVVLLLAGQTTEDLSIRHQWLRYSLDADVPEALGSPNRGGWSWPDPGGSYLAGGLGDSLCLFPIDRFQVESPLLVGRYESDVAEGEFHENGSRVIAADEQGEIRIWSRRSDGRYDLELSRGRGGGKGSILSDSRFAFRKWGQINVLELAFPLAEPMLTHPSSDWTGFKPKLTPDEDWLAVSDTWKEAYFYSLVRRPCLVYRVVREDAGIRPTHFFPDGTRILGRRQGLWLCDVISKERECRFLWRHQRSWYQWHGLDAEARYALVNMYYDQGKAVLIPLDGSEPIVFDSMEAMFGGIAIDPYRNRVALSGGFHMYVPSVADEAIIRIHDLDSGAVQVLETGGMFGFSGLWFLPGDRLVSTSFEGIFLWDLATGEYEALSERRYWWIGDLDERRRYLVVRTLDGVVLWDLEDKTERALPIASEGIKCLTISADGSLVAAGTNEGRVLLLPLDSDEPHVLFGHEGAVRAVWISPGNDEIRSTGDDGTVRIWEMPEGPPLISRPRGELLDILRAQTNVRVVVDAEAEDGYRVVYDPFPGWKTAPTW
jgi:WD40 repeat protein